jgi:hypothetical protein
MTPTPFPGQTLTAEMHRAELQRTRRKLSMINVRLALLPDGEEYQNTRAAKRILTNTFNWLRENPPKE